MFLAKLFETCQLIGGWGVWLLQHVNNGILHVSNNIYVNKLNDVKVILDLFKLAKHPCNIQYIHFLLIAMFVKYIWAHYNVIYVTF